MGLLIFGGVYLLAFIAIFILLFETDASFEKGSELVRFMVQSLIPLVTLVVGYYLGDRNRQQQSQAQTRTRKCNQGKGKRGTGDAIVPHVC